MRRHLAAVVVVMSVVALVLSACEPLRGSSTATSTGPGPTTGPTTGPTETVTTQPELVRVPSYTEFKSSYTGNDWEQTLAAWKAAVEEGFSQAGLVANIELVAPGDTEYQDPAAGTMVPPGTVVHIRVAVYD